MLLPPSHFPPLTSYLSPLTVVIVLGYGLALLIGMSLGLLGGGGAILTIPTLHHVMGYSVPDAVPMSLVVVGVTSGLGAVSHWREGHVQPRTAFAYGVPAMLGAVLGADLGPRTSDEFRLVVFGIVLLIAAAVMFRGTVRADRANQASGANEAVGSRVPSAERGAAEPPSRPAVALVGVIGAGVGLLTGFVGVGGGFLYVPTLTVLAGLPIKHAVGTSLVLIILSCAAGLARYLGNPELGGLDWRAIGLFTAIALVGAAIGSRLVHSVSQRHLRRGFAGFLLVLGVVVLIAR
ncbi:MAG: sulfite exporter TauE/SafE family protein [Gemmatimonadales bacterium]